MRDRPDTSKRRRFESRTVPVWGFSASLALVSGCGEPLDAPSAFESQQFLCGPEHADEFERAIDECRQARVDDETACQGVLSLQGVLDSVPVVLGMRADDASFVDELDATFGRTRTLVVNARAPYFDLRLDLVHSFDPQTGALIPLLSGTQIGGVSQMSLNIVTLEARGGNYLTLLQSEESEIEFQTSTELRSSLHAQTNGGGQVELCLHVFPTPPAR